MALNSHLCMRLSSEAVTLLILRSLHLKIFCCLASASEAKDIMKHSRKLVRLAYGNKLCTKKVLENDKIKECCFFYHVSYIFRPKLMFLS